MLMTEPSRRNNQFWSLEFGIFIFERKIKAGSKFHSYTSFHHVKGCRTPLNSLDLTFFKQTLSCLDLLNFIQELPDVTA